MMKPNTQFSQKFNFGLGILLGLLYFTTSSTAAVEQWINGDWKVTRWGGSGADIIKCDMDSEGNVWFGTLNGGLSYFDGNDITSFSGSGLTQTHIFNSVYVDPSDTVFWSGASGNVVKIYDKQQVDSYETNGFIAYALAKNPEGRLFVFTGKTRYLENSNWIIDEQFESLGGWPREMVFTSDTTFWLFNGGG